ncbi:MAG: hypothetical protein GY749_24605 [Desulfobacteraceae bacterium]|nr:hypothetical protein [Desulfobacteraceae bacterium]
MKVINSVIIFLIIAGISYAGVDKSGVKPSVLSLPSGPGSIEGLGESFEPQLNSGTATYRVPLAVLPGRNGFAPDLALDYNSGNGNSTFGLGWKIGIPYIQRQTDKGLPYYTDGPDIEDNDHDKQIDEPDETDTIIYSNGEKLVLVDDGSFRCKNESEFIRFARSSDTWTATRRDGTVLRFGMTLESRIQDDEGKIFKWLLKEMKDTNGNIIRFIYEKLDSGFQRYCTRIEYNFPSGCEEPCAKSMAILFEYEPRPDIITDYRPRFELKTAFRCKKIIMKEGENHVRSYGMGYIPADNPSENYHFLSLLSEIKQYGKNEEKALPPAEFTYVEFNGKSALPSDISSAPKLSLNNGDIDLMDLNADGLPDILDTSDKPHDYYLNLGIGEDGKIRWTDRKSMTAPSKWLNLDTDSTQLADMDGDGQTDILDLFNSDVQFYRVRRSDTDLRWESGGFISESGFIFDAANVRLADLNNDKLIDVIKLYSGDCSVWLNMKDGRWSSAFTSVLTSSQLDFGRSSVRLADMNGDRIQDIVVIRDGICTYYPGMGFDKFGPAVQMENPPFGVDDQSRLLMADVNGDGMNDVLYVKTGSVKVWLNIGLDPLDHTKGRFANFFPLKSVPYTDSYTVFRQCDINGNGTKDILWNTHPGGGSETFAYVDFAAGEKPYQLKTITNGIGRTVTIHYRSSTEDMARDRDAGRPWQENVPFPVPVVGKVEVSDGQNTYSTEFAYHDGFYDGEEKEFRGFAKVEKQEKGDNISVPDLILVHNFDTGVEYEAMKGRTLKLEAQNAQGEIFYRENYIWNVRPIENNEIMFAYQEVKTRDILEKGNGSPVQLKWEYDYDNYGNLTKLTEHGRTDEGWDDERVTETSFTADYPSGKAKWILDKVVENITKDETGKLVAQKHSFYDENSVPGEVEKGNLTMVREWVSSDKYVTSENDYDAYGNIIAIYDPMYGREPGHYRVIKYDTDYHTFPVEERIYTGTVELSLSAKYKEYYGFGVMESSTDFNGNTTIYTVQRAFGKKAESAFIVKFNQSKHGPDKLHGQFLFIPVFHMFLQIFLQN